MTTLTDIRPPSRLPKTADLGDHRYYGWDCPGCGTEWRGSYNRDIIETGGCEPYTLYENDQDCGSYSYETAELMHADFRTAFADHACHTT